MKTSYRPLGLAAGLWLMSVGCSLPAQAASGAGSIIYSHGQAQILRAGQVQAAAKGLAVQSGDTLSTGQGQAQVKFTDGAYVALGPQSEFAIEKYLDAQNPEQDSFITRFAKGSMRAITGLIGKRDRRNYKVHTTTATLGIRGSSFVLAYQPNGSLLARTEEDGIELCTQAGCVGLNAGQSAWVHSATAAPVVVSAQAEPARALGRRDASLANEAVNGAGQAWPALGVSQPGGDPLPENGTITGLSAVYSGTGLGSGADGSNTASADTGATGLVYQASNVLAPNDVPTGTSPSMLAGTVLSGMLDANGVASDDFSYLGYWAFDGQAPSGAATVGATAFVLGSATPQNFELAPNTTLVYNQVLGSPVVLGVLADGSLDESAGTLSNISLSVNPARASADFSATLGINSTQSSYELERTGFEMSGKSFVTALDVWQGGQMLTSSQADLAGMLMGPQAERAGIAIHFVDPNVGDISAAAVLGQ